MRNVKVNSYGHILELNYLDISLERLKKKRLQVFWPRFRARCSQNKTEKL